MAACRSTTRFGRPNLLGYFRTSEQEVAGEVRGYHKPIMIAGGVGKRCARDANKHPLTDGALIVHLAGPACLIAWRRCGVVDGDRRQHG